MHYICTGGCKGKSGEPGECKAEDCPKKGEQLTPCNCADNQHGGAFE